VDALLVASAADPSLYKWSPVPQGKLETASYVQTALAWRDVWRRDTVCDRAI
jgi:hypothetical protein